jgi:hypothetical protein
MKITEEKVYVLMENVEIKKEEFNHFAGSPQTYWEPEEPEELEIHVIAEYEGLDSLLTEEELDSLQSLKRSEHFRAYCEVMLQSVLETKFYDEELTYWETIIHEEDIEIIREGNKLTIDVYYLG